MRLRLDLIAFLEIRETIINLSVLLREEKHTIKFFSQESLMSQIQSSQAQELIISKRKLDMIEENSH
jgi:hypothetical protein